MDMGDTEDVGRRLGMFMSILSIGALAGPPISGAISTATGGFKDVGYYAGLAFSQIVILEIIPTEISLYFHVGTSVLVGVGMMCVVRHLLLRRNLGKVV
jgi:MFS transporter, MCT family, solute carrier family 16 (monocarboxylic acid transporters), member 10